MNKELIDTVLETDKRIQKVKSYLKNSKYLAGIEISDDFGLCFNEFRSNLNIIIKYTYWKLPATLEALNKENIYLHFRTAWKADGDYIFVFGKGALEVWFYAKAKDIPEQLRKYKRK